MTNIIELKNISIKLWKKQVLNNLNLNIKKWEILWFLGQNWSGKSTLLKILSWTIKRDSWIYKFDWEDFTLENLNEIWALIDHPITFENNTAYENLKIFSLLSNQKNDIKRFDEILDLVWLDKDFRKQKASKYSLWMRQKLAIWLMLIWDPKFIIADEVVNGLDISWLNEIRKIFKNLQEKWITIIVSSHILQEIEKVCDRVAILSGWNIKFEWTLDDLRKYWTNIEESYLSFITN